MAVDYKSKYLDLRQKFMKMCDRYYRMGMEEGLQQGQIQAQMEQMAQQQQEMAAQQAAMQGGAPQIDPQTGEPIPPEQGGAPMPEQGGEGMPPEMAEMGEEPMPEGAEGGSELDAALGELEQLVAKGEKPKVTDIRKAAEKLLDIRKAQTAKMKPNHKKVVVSKQKDLVNGILKKWEDEANSKKSVTADLEKIIQEEGIELE